MHAAGLSVRRFARDVLRRDERTVRSWLWGEQPIPEMVQLKLASWMRQQSVARSLESDPPSGEPDADP